MDLTARELELVNRAGRVHDILSAPSVFRFKFFPKVSQVDRWKEKRDEKMKASQYYL